MHTLMLGPGQDDEVLWPIVGLVVVEVVHDFRSKQRSAEHRLGNDTVFTSSIALSVGLARERDIAVRVKRLTGPIVRVRRTLPCSLGVAVV